jgi:hypothetical protein
MHNGVEMLLKVDAFAEAICGHENVPLARAEFGNLLLTLIVAVVAGNRLDMEARELTAEEFAHPLGDIVGRRDEAAKDDRPIAAAHQIPKDLGELRQRLPVTRTRLRTCRRALAGALIGKIVCRPDLIGSDPSFFNLGSR